MSQLLLLDLLKLSLLCIQLLSHDSSLLQVVQSVLLLDLLVLLDLGSQLVRVFEQDLLLLLLLLLFSLSLFLLLLNDSEELVSLLFGLFGEEAFLLLELAFSGFGHFVEDFDLLFLFLFFFESC